MAVLRAVLCPAGPEVTPLKLAGLAVSMIKISAWIVLGMLGLVYGKDIPSLVELFPGL